MHASEAYPRDALSATELGQLKWLTGGLLALLSMGAVFYLEPGALPLFLAAAAVIALALARPDMPERIPPWHGKS